VNRRIKLNKFHSIHTLACRFVAKMSIILSFICYAIHSRTHTHTFAAFKSLCYASSSLSYLPTFVMKFSRSLPFFFFFQILAYFKSPGWAWLGLSIDCHYTSLFWVLFPFSLLSCSHNNLVALNSKFYKSLLFSFSALLDHL
jgi:hypothetical protein